MRNSPGDRGVTGDIGMGGIRGDTYRVGDFDHARRAAAGEDVAMSTRACCWPIRPAGLADTVRLVVAQPGDGSAIDGIELAVQSAVEEALDSTVGQRSLVRAHERRRDARSATIAGMAVSAAARDYRAAAAAAPADTRVGVSLERDGRISVAHERFFLTPAERRLVGTVGRTALWTLKDAAWKALTPIADDPTPPDLELLFDRSGGLRVATVRGRGVSLRAVLVAPWAGYVLGVVWTDPVRSPPHRGNGTSRRNR